MISFPKPSSRDFCSHSLFPALNSRTTSHDLEWESTKPKGDMNKHVFHRIARVYLVSFHVFHAGKLDVLGFVHHVISFMYEVILAQRYSSSSSGPCLSFLLNPILHIQYVDCICTKQTYGSFLDSNIWSGYFFL